MYIYTIHHTESEEILGSVYVKSSIASLTEDDLYHMICSLWKEYDQSTRDEQYIEDFVYYFNEECSNVKIDSVINLNIDNYDRNL